MTLVPPANRDPKPEKGAGERDLLISWLDWHRATMLAKCQGLDSAQLGQRSCPPSDLTLLGLIRHLTEIERNYFAAWAGITEPTSCVRPSTAQPASEGYGARSAAPVSPPDTGPVPGRRSRVARSRPGRPASGSSARRW